MNEEFYVGQKAVIIDNTLGHDLPLGTIVTLTRAEQLTDGYWDLASDYIELDNDDCKPYIEEENK